MSTPNDGTPREGWPEQPPAGAAPWPPGQPPAQPGGGASWQSGEQPAQPGGGGSWQSGEQPAQPGGGAPWQSGQQPAQPGGGVSWQSGEQPAQPGGGASWHSGEQPAQPGGQQPAQPGQPGQPWSGDAPWQQGAAPTPYGQSPVGPPPQFGRPPYPPPPYPPTGSAPYGQPYGDPPKTSRRKRLLVIGAIVAAVIVALGIIGSIAGGNRNPRDTADQFMAALKAKDVGKAHSLLCKDGKDKESESALRDDFDLDDRTITGYTLGTETKRKREDKDETLIPVSITYDSGRPVNLSLGVWDEGGQKVCSLNDAAGN